MATFNKKKDSDPLIPIGGNIEGLPPIEDEACHLLILGTMPGVESLKQQAYYANPRNLFWKLLSGITGKQVPDNYEDKKAWLTKNKIALWDTCRTCIRNGSLDSNISEEMPNDIRDFISSHPHLKAIGFNGKTSERLFRKYIANIDTVNLISLPSSSPANASIKWEKKVEEWSKLKEFI
ncbi:MAG: DNA-deoxyinosine glycosylase [Paludibacter sp.]|nr:DNA-deoxyinosine glycosylase [Paludibacter sp.]